MRAPAGRAFDTLVPVPGLTNSFEYDQAVHALYGTYQFALGKLEVQAGLRLEQVEIEIDQITGGMRFDDDYFRAYPTLHLGYGSRSQAGCAAATAGASSGRRRRTSTRTRSISIRRMSAGAIRTCVPK